jgi:Hydrogenase maturation protease
VKVVDFGIRSLDFTYALLDGYDAALLIDTARRGEAPGTVSVIEPDRPAEGSALPEDLVLEPHDLDPAKVLRVIAALGGSCPRIIVRACEPLTFGRRRHGIERPRRRRGRSRDHHGGATYRPVVEGGGGDVMSYATKLSRRAKRALPVEESRSSGAGWRTAGAVLGVLFVLTVAANAKDMMRYIKISSM